ncbi:hypothetical protein QQ045_031477 [Rhodiola kirilowii]
MAPDVQSTVLILLALLVSLSDAKPIELNQPAMFNFGDSNSDTGNIIAVGIGDPLDPPYGQSFFNAPSGRFSDGRLIIDFLADGLGKQFLNPYVKSVGAPKFQQGCNFAAAGSTVLNQLLIHSAPFRSEFKWLSLRASRHKFSSFWQPTRHSLTTCQLRIILDGLCTLLISGRMILAGHFIPRPTNK